MNGKIQQPPWHPPAQWRTPEQQEPTLRVYNSLTKQKDEFIPSNQRQVTWYACGPTVYAPSHMGHARTYISFDIIRRILEEYFGYNVLFVMNITDVDDKIIIEARHKLLFNQFKQIQSGLNPSVLETVQAAWSAYVTDKFQKYDPQAATNWSVFVSQYAPGTPKAPTFEQEPKYEMHFKLAKSAREAIDVAAQRMSAGGPNGKEAVEELCDACRSVLSAYLDKKEGHLVTDPKHFREFAAFWENEFFKDMDNLNIRRPDVLTRVTEYVPEIVDFVEKIIQNKFAYESEGSVYFDTVRFDGEPGCNYAKLEPWSAGNVKLLQEGEGDLSAPTSTEKRHKSDFALWKKSKPGEPAWPSPWGEGRPGWHIECSVMASHVLGSNIDIHSGGIDLAFPHHDNELAQSEAYHKCPQWINYFWHTGHLHIEGQKMSKSLKNFISIKEALEKYSVVQIRIMFLMHNWDSTLDFKETTLQEAKDFENRLNVSLAMKTDHENFFINVKAEVQRLAQQPPEFTGKNDFGQSERNLTQDLLAKQVSIHAALCDSFNTPKVMQDIRDLVAASNNYLNEKMREKSVINTFLITKIAKYVTRLMRIFGVAPEDTSIGLSTSSSAASGNSEDIAMPYLKVLADYRDGIRNLAQQKADHKAILELCDQVRDMDLVELGVALDDRADGKALVKFVDRETLVKQREEKKQRELERQKERQARLEEQNRKKQEKLKKAAVPPELMYKDEESVALYSKWDEQGIPTHDKQGEELSKKKRKNLVSDFEKQIKLHQDYKDGKLF